ncbi:MAG: bacillithiol system redox-active protein YtxJ [Bryobacteraceae bacterium]
MFRWGAKAAHDIPELASTEDFDALLGHDLVIVFKHSPACVISWMAHAQVVRFLTAHPHARVYLISVRQRRDLARYVAQQTGVQHESPQVLVLRRGNLIAAASHDDITSELLSSLLQTD